MKNQVYPVLMSIRSTWLRSLLSLGLILNGSSYSMASAHAGLEMEGAAPSSSGASNDLTAMPPCHESVANSESIEKDISSTAAESDTPSKLALSGCCKSGKCNCACVHAVFALPSIARIDVVSLRGPIVRPIVIHHATPVLSRLSRPPIV